MLIFERLTSEEARTYGLVLASVGISYRLIKGSMDWSILVSEQDSLHAKTMIRCYLEEQQETRHVPEESSAGRFWPLSAGLSALLLSCHAAISLVTDPADVVERFGVSVSGLRSGELYRTITALFIHGDFAHLAGNILGILLFGTAVCHVMGWGVGWFTVLVSAALGNLLNGLIRQGDHLSIGASTAVFAAIGILTARQFLRRVRLQERRAKAWFPVAGGLALLSILGSGQHSDLMAHLLGFLVGLSIGMAYGFLVNRTASTWLQGVFMGATIGMVIAAWLRLLHS